MPRFSMYAHPHLRYSGSKFGYAYTYNEIYKHMQNVMVDGKTLNVGMNSPKSKIQMNYGSPPGVFYSHQYKIQMSQWESTCAPTSHADLSKQYDEWWTANAFGRAAYINAGVDESKIHVFEHGIDSDVWNTHLRGRRNKLRFLHIDSGSPRKRADIARSAFKSAFGDNPNYELTLKWSHTPMIKRNWFDEDVLSSVGNWDNNVREIHENLELEELVSLFHFHDALIYPSEGEGFGLIPLQALATGMPVISTHEWCSYSDLFKEFHIESTFGVSPIVESYHRPGNVILPNEDSVTELMQAFASNAQEYSNIFFLRAAAVRVRYNWNIQCQKIIDSLVSRIGVDQFEAYTGYLSK